MPSNKKSWPCKHQYILNTVSTLYFPYIGSLSAPCTFLSKTLSVDWYIHKLGVGLNPSASQTAFGVKKKKLPAWSWVLHFWTFEQKPYLHFGFLVRKHRLVSQGHATMWKNILLNNKQKGDLINGILSYKLVHLGGKK